MIVKVRQYGGWLPWAVSLMLVLGSHISLQQQDEDGVKVLTNTPNRVVLDNGLVQVTFSHPGGDAVEIKYSGIDNLLEVENGENNRGYWDVLWSNPGKKQQLILDRLQGSKFKVITAREDLAEVSFIKTYNVSSPGGRHVPLNVDKRYIMQRGRSGFYAYAIFERLEGWPGAKMGHIRLVFKLQQAKFRYMAVSDTRQRFMPTVEDRRHGKRLAYAEAVLLTNATSNPVLAGEVDDKYQYSTEDKDSNVHGWVCTNGQSLVGFWMITPSTEFHNGGPLKQDLTSHVGPTTMSVFSSTHYAGDRLAMGFREGEAWKKVFGPVFVYLNSADPSNGSTTTLWNDAKEQLSEEVESWPYNFTNSQDYPSSDQRGLVSGHLQVIDNYISESSLLRASSAYVGLCTSGEVGSWQRQSKGYQFWTRANENGEFVIKDVRSGSYSLYAWVPGIIGEYKYPGEITIKPGSRIRLDKLSYKSPRSGPTLWEIGIPDRSAAEFYIPEPYPTLMNKFHNNHYSDVSDKFRQYGIRDRYEELYPNHDLIYNVGSSNYRNDWFYAHVTRNIGNQTYVGTTWQVKFELDNVTYTGNYTLRLALASATLSELQIRFNNRSVAQPLFSSGVIGEDNAIARHGIHGLYWLFNVNVPSSLLSKGNNTMYLTQSRDGFAFRGIMYDYIRLEAPPLLESFSDAPAPLIVRSCIVNIFIVMLYMVNKFV